MATQRKREWRGVRHQWEGFEVEIKVTDVNLQAFYLEEGQVDPEELAVWFGNISCGYRDYSGHLMAKIRFRLPRGKQDRYHNLTFISGDERSDFLTAVEIAVIEWAQKYGEVAQMAERKYRSFECGPY